jgi:hypothetical protein
VPDTTETLVRDTPPTVAVAPLMKLVPVIVKEILPVIVPLVGEIEVTVGALAYATITIPDPPDPPLPCPVAEDE